jgi:hypothetical protein
LLCKFCFGTGIHISREEVERIIEKFSAEGGGIRFRDFVRYVSHVLYLIIVSYLDFNHLGLWERMEEKRMNNMLM